MAGLADHVAASVGLDVAPEAIAAELVHDVCKSPLGDSGVICRNIQLEKTPNRWWPD